MFQPGRYKTSELAFFARWENEEALENFLKTHFLNSWHVRLKFYRRWGHLRELNDLPENSINHNQDAPVVGITLARLNLSETIRFLKWGKPVEKLVRDHPGKTFAMASMRPLNTLSTFSIWKNEREMINMVSGKTNHAEAMKEQAQKSFHHEFTTMRFHLLGEYGDLKRS